MSVSEDVRVYNADLSRKLGEINEQLAALSSDSENPPSQSMQRAIQRHRDVDQDYSRELKRTKVGWCSLWEGLVSADEEMMQTNVQHALDQANLLSGVRNDIEYVCLAF